MKIKLKISESSSVEVIPCDECEAIQGECCITELELEYPTTIKGYPIANYAKYIEFAECKEVGQCAKFVDEIDGNTYKLKEPATSFTKIKIQFRFENTIDESLVLWKSKVFVLEFAEAINAEETVEVQNQLLSLKEIKEDWKNYIEANTFRVIKSANDIPTANSDSLDNIIFYLGEEFDNFSYSHYYQCTHVNNIYEWTDISLLAYTKTVVTTAIEEINNNQEMQMWIGTKKELEAETLRNNIMYIPTDQNFDEVVEETLIDMTENVDDLVLGEKHIPVLTDKLQVDENGVLKLGDIIIPQRKLLYDGEEFGFIDITSNQTMVYSDLNGVMGRTFEIQFTEDRNAIYTVKFKTKEYNSNFITIQIPYDTYYMASGKFHAKELVVSLNQTHLLCHVNIIQSESATTELSQLAQIYRIYEIIE